MKRVFSTLVLAAAAALMFTSCDNGDGNGTGTYSLEISNIEGLPEAATRLKVMIYDEVSDTPTELATADLKDGKFEVDLPATVDSNLLRPFTEEMPEGITVSNTDTKAGDVEFEIYDATGYLGEIYLLSSSATVSYLYVDSACTATGSYVEDEDEDEDEEYTVNVNVSLVKGWNRIALIKGEEADVTTTIPSGVTWMFE